MAIINFEKQSKYDMPAKSILKVTHAVWLV